MEEQFESAIVCMASVRDRVRDRARATVRVRDRVRIAGHLHLHLGITRVGMVVLPIG